MRAVVLERQGEPLKPTTLPEPEPQPGQLLLKIAACAVCRTDLHLRDHEIEATKLPVVLGHQIVARTQDGQRVGVPWLGWTDGTCRYCRTDRENLCVNGRFTGRDIDGGFAELTVADERYCLALPDELSDEQAAPLLCGGLIGYRALRFTGDAARLGLYGFGSAAHQICQVAVHQGREVSTRSRDRTTSALRSSPEASAPSGPAAATNCRPSSSTPRSSSLRPASSSPRRSERLAPGGTVVCAGIHMTDIPSFPYEILWGERSIRSVANLTRKDGEEFLALAPQVAGPQHDQHVPARARRAGAWRPASRPLRRHAPWLLP